MIIHILNKYEVVSGVLSNEAPFSCPFFDDLHTENIRMGTNSYEFSVPAKHEMANKLEVEGSVVFPNLDGQMQLFKIKEIEETANADGYVKRVYAEHTAISDLLTDGVIRPFEYTGYSLDTIINEILKDTDYKLGDWETTILSDVKVDNHSTVLEVLYLTAEAFQVEIQFEAILKNGVIEEKLVHLKEKLGTVTNKLFTYSKDLVEVVRTENSEALVTALIGVGKGDSEGTQITLSNYNPEELPLDFYKKLEDDFIYSESAFQAYNKNGKHLFGVYVSDKAEDKETLAKETVQQLKARCVPFVTYEMQVALLERISGYSADKIRVGDTINAKDITMNPTLMIEARILEVTRSYTDVEKDSVVLGNYRPVRISAYDDVNKLRQAIIANEEKWNNSGVSLPEVEEVVEGKVEPIERGMEDVQEELKAKEYMIIRQAEEPEGIDFPVGQLWINDAGYIHKWTGTEWDKIISVSIDDIGAVSGEEYDKAIKEMTEDIADKVGVDYVDGKLVYKADADSVYTKVETDTKLDDKAEVENVYSKTEVDNALDSKVSTTQFTTDMEGVITDLESHDSRITQTEDEIKSTVSSEEYSQKVTELEGNIADKADTASVESIETRVGEAETAITQADESIKLKADAKDVYTKTETDGIVNSVENRVEETEAFIEVNRDKIINSVSKTEVDTAIDGLEIGGRNLIKDSKKNILLPKNTGTLNDNFNYKRFYSTDGLVEGQKYTFSANIEITHGDFNSVTLYEYPSGSREDVSISEDGYVDRTFSANSTSDSMLVYAGVSGSTGNNGVVIHEAKLEKGNKATDWTPAPEDVQSQLDSHDTTISDHASRITQTEKDITNTVSSTKYEADMNGLSTRMETAESNITQSAKEIESKVEETDFTGETIVSKVNQTAGAYKIDANNIELNGKVKFTDLDADAQGTIEDKAEKTDVDSINGKINNAVTTIDGSGVTVKDGGFFLQDDITDIQYSVTPKRNFIKDHSFELLKAGEITSTSVKYNWVEIIPDIFGDYWRTTRSPKLAIQFAPEDAKALAIYGRQAVAVRNANFVRQDVYDGIGGGATYTISGFFKRQWNVQGGGTPRFEIDHVGMDGSYLKRLINVSFDAVPDDYSVVRRSATFTVPTTFKAGDMLDVKVTGGNSYWVQCDGIQLVEGTEPSVYQPEDSIWEITKGDYPTPSNQRLLWSGASYPVANAGLKPDKKLLDCENGWLLQWSRYVKGDGTRNSHYQYTPISKQHAYEDGTGVSLSLGYSFANPFIRKYIYVHNDKIDGHGDNKADIYHNLVLRGIYEW